MAGIFDPNSYNRNEGNNNPRVLEHVVSDKNSTHDPSEYSSMVKDIRGWGMWLIILGIIQIVAAGYLSAPWGIFLIIVGLASFYFYSAAMYIVYGCTLAWVAISNFSSGEVLWMGFAVVQVFISIRVFKQFSRFRSIPMGVDVFSKQVIPEGLPKEDRAKEPFSWISLLVGVLSLFVFIALVVWIARLLGPNGEGEVPAASGFAEEMIVNLAVLGFATGLASVLLDYPRKPLSIIGMVLGGLVLAAETIAFFLL